MAHYSHIPASMMEAMASLSWDSLMPTGYPPAINFPGMTQFELRVGPFISAFSSIIEASMAGYIAPRENAHAHDYKAKTCRPECGLGTRLGNNKYKVCSALHWGG